MKYAATLSAVLIVMSASASHAATCATTGCPAGQSCQNVQIDPFTTQEMCVNNPVPEMDILMIPAAMGAAGLFAYRARKKAQKKST